jgi:molybdate-binding protein
MINPQLQDKVSRTEQLLDRKYRWTFRQNGAGTQRYLLEVLARHQVRLEDLGCVRASLSDREAASAVSRNLVDVAPGTRATAMEYGLAFVADGWESYDFALLKDIWFRRLFQSLLARLKSKQTLELADELGGYDLRDSGELVWSEE